MENLENIDNELLEHAVINEIEKELKDGSDYTAISGMLELLLKDDKSKKILFDYLGDPAQEDVINGRTHKRY